MFIYDIIDKKRNKKSLTKNEIEFAVNSYVNKSITDAQMSALLMAIAINDMTYKEIYHLTNAMKNSGEVLEFNELIIDKHSTGGVGDSTTLILTPVLACLGIKVAKMSGKALGFTGGTINKLAVFEGYNANIPLEEFKKNIKKINCSIITQSEKIAYADKLIYDLRDETASVESIPLIASSVMSKKLAGGCKFLILNVHFGKGALIKNYKDALKLAQIMVRLGQDNNVTTKVVISNMNVPLSNAVGCALEVKSVLRALNGEKSRLSELSYELCAQVLISIKKISKTKAYKLIDQTINSGEAKNKFKELIKAHYGNEKLIDNPNLIKVAKHKIEIKSEENGYINDINAYAVAKAVQNLVKQNPDLKTKNQVGIELKTDINSYVKNGDVLAEIYVNDTKTIYNVESYVKNIFEFSKHKVKENKLILKVI